MQRNEQAFVSPERAQKRNLFLISSVLLAVLFGAYCWYAVAAAKRNTLFSMETRPEAISTALSKNPNDPAALRGMASQLVIKGDKEGAILYLRKLLAVRPYDESSRMDLVFLLVQTNRKEEAVRILRQMAKGNNSHSSEAKRRLRELGAGSE
jgi:Flp pilus assembly protein TadD